jgi:hypothetical protein
LYLYFYFFISCHKEFTIFFLYLSFIKRSYFHQINPLYVRDKECFMVSPVQNFCVFFVLIGKPIWPTQLNMGRRDHMLVGLKITCATCWSPLKLRVWISLMARCTRYNIMWWSLSVTCSRSIVFSPPRFFFFFGGG